MKLPRRPYIIAEAGSCHEGSLDNALLLVGAAKGADADAVKFQFWSSPGRMRARRHAPPPTYDRGSVEEAWLPKLADLAHSMGLEFLCTAYLPEDIGVVAAYVDRFKVSSFEPQGFVNLHLYHGKPVIVSCGMGRPPDLRVASLLCVSAYPTPPEEAALGRIRRGYDGYSDHTCKVMTGALAVACGAEILEVHFRLPNTSTECPDYVVSLDPFLLATYVATARRAHSMVYDGRERGVQPAEVPNMDYRVKDDA